MCKGYEPKQGEHTSFLFQCKAGKHFSSLFHVNIYTQSTGWKSTHPYLLHVHTLSVMEGRAHFLPNWNSWQGEHTNLTISSAFIKLLERKSKSPPLLVLLHKKPRQTEQTFSFIEIHGRKSTSFLTTFHAYIKSLEKEVNLLLLPCVSTKGQGRESRLYCLLKIMAGRAHLTLHLVVQTLRF